MYCWDSSHSAQHCMLTHWSPSSAIIVAVLSCHPRLQGALSVLEETELKAGKFGVIRSLLRALDGGAAAKAALDTVIDACSGMQAS